MERKTTASLAKLCNLTLLFALFLAWAPAVSQASSTNPCSSFPGACRYTWDPVERCCIADPRFDCYDVCFASATGAAPPWQAALALPSPPPISSPAEAALSAPAHAAASSAPGSGQR
jgi:hypothetical protein